MRAPFGVSGHWRGEWDEAGVERWASALRARLGGPDVSLGTIFVAPNGFPDIEALLEVIRLHARVPLLIGASSPSLICDGQEAENTDGVVLSLFRLPGASLKAFHISQQDVEQASGANYWRQLAGGDGENANAWIALACPQNLDGETWLEGWNSAFPGVPVSGGLACGAGEESPAQVYLNGQAFDEGAVMVRVGGDVTVEPVVSQGCTPIGDAWTITQTDRNFILKIGNRPAYSVLVDTFNRLSTDERAKLQQNLFIGLASDEYRDEFRRGDFLVRNLIGADPQKGALAVGAIPRAGQTIQFQRRDSAAATEDLSLMLAAARERLKGRAVYGGLAFFCLGRGAALFGGPSHDAGLVQEQLGPLPVSGFFCNGEIGPVGPRNFFHGYTASLAVFASR